MLRKHEEQPSNTLATIQNTITTIEQCLNNHSKQPENAFLYQ